MAHGSSTDLEKQVADLSETLATHAAALVKLEVEGATRGVKIDAVIEQTKENTKEIKNLKDEIRKSAMKVIIAIGIGIVAFLIDRGLEAMHGHNQNQSAQQKP